MRRLAVAVAAVAVWGCSGSSGPSASASLDAAISATTAAGSVHEAVSSVTPTASGSQTSTGTGAYEFAGGTGQFNVDTGGLLGKLDVVLRGGTLYIKVPAAELLVTKGKAWVSAMLDDPPTLPGAGNLTSLAGGADPARLFNALGHARTSVTKAGAGHYTVKVDLKSNPLNKLVGGALATDDVFTDAAGRITKVVQHVALAGNATGTITTDYSDFGVAVHASTPAAADILDARTLLASQ